MSESSGSSSILFTIALATLSEMVRRPSRGIKRTDRACEPAAQHVSSRSIPTALGPAGKPPGGGGGRGGSAIRTKSLDVFPPCAGVALPADMVSAKRSGARGWDTSRPGAGIVELPGGRRIPTECALVEGGLSAPLELRRIAWRCRCGYYQHQVSGAIREASRGCDSMRRAVGDEGSGSCARYRVARRARREDLVGCLSSGPESGYRCVQSVVASDVGMRSNYLSMASRETIGGHGAARVFDGEASLRVRW